ncbi:MAG: zinc-ribbon domain-containing protein [Clostridia bacterium]|nr:zinc-ribbon domain-containing protein [Clostridia bacterium]
MAGGFDKFMSSVNRGITTINVKTSSSLEKAKIKTHIDTLNSEIAKLFSLSGEMSYYKWKNSNEDLADVYANFEIIKKKFEEIEELKLEMEKVDEKSSEILGGNSRTGQTTSSTPPSNSQVQPAPTVQQQPTTAVTENEEKAVADAKSEAVEAAPKAQGIVCSNCGSEYNNTAKFCRKCGTKLQ